MPLLQGASAATHLYRIAQEAVADAIKHSSARSILVRLNAEPDAVCLRLEDDDRGIP